MTSFDFTPRIATFFTRFLDINKKKFIEKTQQYIQMSDEDLRDEIGKHDGDIRLGFREFGNVTCTVDLMFEEDDDENIIRNSIDILVVLRLKTLSSHRTWLGSHKMSLLTNEKEWIDNLVKIYTVCVCGESLAEKDGWCFQCYPSVIKQGENCCVCLEDEGVWIEIPCGHKIHEYCWLRIKETKCPLCRHDVSHKGRYTLI